MRMVTPDFLNPSTSWALAGSERVLSLSKAKVGWPDLALASTMNLPMYPVPPIIRILLFSAILILFFCFASLRILETALITSFSCGLLLLIYRTKFHQLLFGPHYGSEQNPHLGYLWFYVTTPIMPRMFHAIKTLHDLSLKSVDACRITNQFISKLL